MKMKDVVKDKRINRIWTIVLCAVMVGCICVMLTLCADEGIDYDESYSFETARDYTQVGIVRRMILDHDTDVPVYYNALRAWLMLFGGIGHRFLAARLFSVAGTAASMLLAVTWIRKLWGNRTALFFMVATSLAPAMLHVGVNIRMYSWTNFLCTAGAVLAFRIVQEPSRRRNWILLELCALTAVFAHYFAVLAFAAIFLYLLLALWRDGRKHVWKVFVGGFLLLAPLLAWMVVSGFFHFVKSAGADTQIKKITIKGLLYHLFQTDMKFCLAIGMVLVVAGILGAVFFVGGKGRRAEKGFALMCILSIFAIYLAMLVLTSFVSHFFIPRHIMHATGMMWLGIAIALPRIHPSAFWAGFVVLASVCCQNYTEEYESAYRDTPYLEDTKVFIEEEMEPGDVVIYTSPYMYRTLYRCYMPEQEFVHLSRMTDEDIRALAGKRVWFFNTNWREYFSQEQAERFGITSENVGHYGFQIMDNCTDFDLLRVEIRGEGE